MMPCSACAFGTGEEHKILSALLVHSAAALPAALLLQNPSPCKPLLDLVYQ